MLSVEDEKKYILAGKIASSARAMGAKLIVPGASLLEIAETVESHIISEGGSLACPATISLNNIAAHYSPTLGDMTKINEKDTVKLDIGVHVDGFIADTAATICLDKEKKALCDCVRKALDSATKMMRPGVKTGDIGAVIQSEIESAGFNPVSNLTGHVLGKYKLHTGVSIPNVKVRSNDILEEGTVAAVEPFATDGVGFVKESGKVQIYMFKSEKPVRLMQARTVLEISKKRFNSMPFSPRWIKDISPQMQNVAIRQLVMSKALYAYPVLQESLNSTVAQAEHTVIVKDRPIVTTL